MLKRVLNRIGVFCSKQNTLVNLNDFYIISDDPFDISKGENMMLKIKFEIQRCRDYVHFVLPFVLLFILSDQGRCFASSSEVFHS